MVDGWRDPAEALAAYEKWLVGLPLSERTRREYARWVRLFCRWLGDGIDERAVGADPLADPRARDDAARDFKRFLKSERMLGPASVNLALAAVDHLYRHLGMERANVRRERPPQTAPLRASLDRGPPGSDGADGDRLLMAGWPSAAQRHELGSLLIRPWLVKCLLGLSPAQAVLVRIGCDGARGRPALLRSATRVGSGSATRCLMG